MRHELQNRLGVLKKEFETGQTRLRELASQESILRETLLRISGAIQVLEELLAESKSDEGRARSPEVLPISSRVESSLPITSPSPKDASQVAK
jgi:predicted nuclease with TOPRIM domain